VRLDISEFHGAQNAWRPGCWAPSGLTWATRKAASSRCDRAAPSRVCCSMRGEGPPRGVQPVAARVLDTGRTHRFPGRTVDFRKPWCD